MDEDSNKSGNGAENIEHDEGSSSQNISNQDNAQYDNDAKNFSMDKNGRIHVDKGGTGAISTASRTYTTLGWISAFLSAFVYPYFAIAGIILGVLANRQQQGSGNGVITANIVAAAINILFGLLFGLFLLSAIRRMVFGY